MKVGQRVLVARYGHCTAPGPVVGQQGTVVGTDEEYFEVRLDSDPVGMDPCLCRVDELELIDQLPALRDAFVDALARRVQPGWNNTVQEAAKNLREALDK